LCGIQSGGPLGRALQIVPQSALLLDALLDLLELGLLVGTELVIGSLTSDKRVCGRSARKSEIVCPATKRACATKRSTYFFKLEWYRKFNENFYLKRFQFQS